MMKAAILVGVVLVSLAAAQYDCGEQPCDRPDIVVDAGDYNFVPADFPKFDHTIARITNSSYVGLLTSGSKAATIEISVGEIVAWLQSGSTNPVEAGIMAKINQFLNDAGIQLDGGSLVYRFLNGQEMILDGAGSCSDVTLLRDWNAAAALKPGFTVKFTFGMDGLALKISSEIVADTAFVMNAQVKVRKGFGSPFGCVRPIVKTTDLSVGAQMILEILSMLEVRPTLVFESGAAVIGIKPTYCLRGSMRYFEPTSKASITIFGIHLTGLERKIEEAIRSSLRDAFSTSTMKEAFGPAATAMQETLNALFADFKIVIPLVSEDVGQALNAALANISYQQDYICSGRRPPRPVPDDGRGPRPIPTPTPGPTPPTPAPGPGPRPRPVRP